MHYLELILYWVYWVLICSVRMGRERTTEADGGVPLLPPPPLCSSRRKLGPASKREEP